MEKEAENFWDSYQPVPETGHVLRRKSIADTNEKLQSLHGMRNQQPVEWLHIAFRFQLRGCLETDYQAETGVDTSVIRNIEAPHKKVLYESLEAVVANWEAFCASTDSKTAEIAQEGKEKFIRAITVEYERLETYRALRTIMLNNPTGEEGFFAGITLTKDQYNNRRNRDRLLSFAELATIARERSLDAYESDQDLWHSNEVQALYTAFIADLEAERSIPAPLASVMAVTEFSNVLFQENSLSELGLSGTVVSKIVSEKELVPFTKLKPLIQIIAKHVDTNTLEEIEAAWKEEYTKQKSRQSFQKIIRAHIKRDNVKPLQLLELCGQEVDTSKAADTVRSALARGPNSRVPPAALLSALAATKQEFEADKKSLLRVFKKRWERSNRSQPELQALLTFYGLSVQDVFVDVETQEQAQQLLYGNTSTLSKKFFMQEVEQFGVTKSIVPTLQRYIQANSPQTIWQTLQVLSGDRGGLTSFCRNAGVHTEIVSPLEQQQPVIPAFIYDVVNQKGIQLPPRAELELLTLYSCRAEAQTFSPFGKVIDSILACSHRQPSHYINSLALPFPPRPSHLNQLQHIEGLPTEILEQINGEELSLETVQYVSCIEQVQQIPKALQAWYNTQLAADNVKACNDFVHLCTMASSQPFTTLPNNVEELFARKEAIYRWKNGQSDAGKSPFAPEELQAIALLKKLPGVSKTDLIECMNTMHLELIEESTAKERLIKNLQKPTNFASGSEEKVFLMMLRVESSVPMHIEGDNQIQGIVNPLTPFEESLLEESLFE